MIILPTPATHVPFKPHHRSVHESKQADTAYFTDRTKVNVCDCFVMWVRKSALQIYISIHVTISLLFFSLSKDFTASDQKLAEFLTHNHRDLKVKAKEKTRFMSRSNVTLPYELTRSLSHCLSCFRRADTKTW